MLSKFLILSLFALSFFKALDAAAMTAADQAVILNCHNSLRSTIAKGTAQNKTGTMPVSANMIQFKYNTSLEAVAASWANQCTMSHSSNGYGENLYMYSASQNNSAALTAACNMWWAELKQYGIQASLVLSSSEFSKGIGHWSQMAWANTKTIGCAVASCPTSTWKTYVVCNYSPPGNYLNQVVYTKGTACGSCASGSSCNSTSSLCAFP